MNKHSFFKFITLIAMCNLAFPLVSMNGLFTAIPNSLIADLAPDTSSIGRESGTLYDSMTMKIYSLYKEHQFAVNSCLILRDTALTDGYSSTREERIIRLSIYAKIFPGIKFDTAMVNNEIIIEKFLKNEMGISPSPIQIDKSYKEFIERYPLNPPPLQNIVYPILSSKTLLTMDTIAHICKEFNEGKLRNNKENDLWPFNTVVLEGDTGRCLVNGDGNEDCFVSVGAFNDFLANYLVFNPIRKAIKLRDAREIALNELLMGCYFEQKAKEKKINEDQENIEKQKRWIESKLLLKKNQVIPNNSYNDHLLNNIYEKYYDRFFKEKIIKKVQLVGSTDSTYIDSLCSIFQKMEKDTMPGRFLRMKAFIDSIPWNSSSLEDLPDTMRLALSSMRIQEYSTIKTSFGSFFCRIISDTRRPGIPFDKARNKLIYLIEEEKARSNGKSDSVRAFAYYRNHSERFLTPDTLLTKAWLSPFIDTMGFKTLEIKKRERIIMRDTGDFRPMILWSNDLPDETKSDFARCYREVNGKKTFIGPLPGRFGTWYFSIKRVRAGRGKIPFAFVKKNILREMEVKNFPFDSLAQTEAGARFLEREILSSAYHASIPIEINALSDEEIQKLIDDKKINISYKNNGKADQRLLAAARQRLLFRKVEQENKNMEQWIKSLPIHRDLLFAGCSDKTNN